MISLARSTVTALVLTGAAAAFAGAQSTTQIVQYLASPINVIAVTGSPMLTITAAAPGAAPDPTSAGGSTWAVTTNQSNARITARTATPMPVGLTLSASMQAPTGGTSTGQQTLTIVPMDMVTGITKIAQGGLSITYYLSATPAAGVISGSMVVTFTVTGGV